MDHKRRTERQNEHHRNDIPKKIRLDRTRNEVCRDELEVESITVTIQRGKLIWLRHVARMGEGRLARKVCEAKEDGKRKKGRLRKTWKKEVKKAYEARGAKWEDARKVCKGREKWKQSWRGDSRNSTPHNPKPHGF